MAVRAQDIQELRPLLELCRAGKLFEVQAWIAQGKPITLAEGVKSHSKLHIPLHVAMLTGFHSLVQVLLEGGAPTLDRSHTALRHAVEMRRPDLARLLLEHGSEPSHVSLCDVIENGCDPQLIDLLLAAGKNLVEEAPIAWGLINCIWPTLKLLKRYVVDCPELLLQVNTALRYHASEGNAKWVALTLWCGGDPLARGPYDLDQDYYDESYPGMNAIEVAALYDRFAVLQQKKMLAAIKAAATDSEALLQVCRSSSSRVLELFLRQGHSPQRMPDKGTEAIERVVCAMDFELTLDRVRIGHYGGTRGDCSGARDKMAMLHILVAHGARWLPQDKDAISSVRKPLLKLVPGFTMEFAWLMKRYGAAKRRDVRDLLAAPTMRRHLSEERVSLDRILEGIPEEPVPPGSVHGEARPSEQGHARTGAEPHPAADASP